MSTVGQVIDRTYREYLALADDQPVQAPLNAGVTAAATTWVLTATGLDADEADVAVEGTLVECGRELALITNVSVASFPASITLTVIRGFAGTTAAAHSAADIVTVAPTFPRQNVFDAVADHVVNLYPMLYQVATTTITTAAYVEVPATVIEPQHFVWESSSRICTASATLYTNLPSGISSTGKAVKVNARNSLSGTLVYHAKFDRPTAESDDLTASFGLEAEWERIVVVGAASQLMAGRELDMVTQEFVTEQLRAQGYPVGSAARQHNHLQQLHDMLLEKASQRQIAERKVHVTVAMPQLGSLG